MKKNWKPTRRGFLKQAAVAAVTPHIFTSSLFGYGGKVSPNERIVLGGIGMGGRGQYDLSAALQEPDVQIAAVCDVKKPNRQQAKAMVDQRYGNQDCAVYSDFRELLARSDIDAIVMAPGDRWHTPMSVLAMRAGKDVYSEKPCTMNISEGKILVDAARRYGRVFQTGMQRRSEANFVFADELARRGMLGNIHTVYAHTLPFEMRTDWLSAQPEPSREELDWDLWLGPASWRPYNQGYLGGCMAWLNYYDFGTGVAGWCSHTICQCQGAINADLTSAIEYEYPGNETAEGFVARYANGVKLVLSCGGWRGTCGVRYDGTEGWVSVADDYTVADVSSESFLNERHKIVKQYMEQNRRPMNHMRDFLNCVKSRRQTVAHPEVAHRSMTTCHAINISMLLKQNLKWNPTKQEFINHPVADRLCSRTVRQPWTI
jgi:predicted dehydrogenase